MSATEKDFGLDYAPITMAMKILHDQGRDEKDNINKALILFCFKIPADRLLQLAWKLELHCNFNISFDDPLFRGAYFYEVSKMVCSRQVPGYTGGDSMAETMLTTGIKLMLEPKYSHIPMTQIRDEILAVRNLLQDS